MDGGGRHETSRGVPSVREPALGGRSYRAEELWAGGRAGAAERSSKIMLDIRYWQYHYTDSIKY